MESKKKQSKIKTCLSRSSHIYLPGGYISGPNPADIIQSGILSLCSKLKDDAVALVDVFAPPDFVLHSAIGSADGQVSLLISTLYHEGQVSSNG